MEWEEKQGKRKKKHGNNGGKNKGREKNTERGRPNGGKHLRGKTHVKRVVSTQREVPRKRKDQKGGPTYSRRVIRN